MSPKIPHEGIIDCWVNCITSALVSLLLLIIVLKHGFWPMVGHLRVLGMILYLKAGKIDSQRNIIWAVYLLSSPKTSDGNDVQNMYFVDNCSRMKKNNDSL